MNINYHKIFSKELNEDFEMKVYGHAGKPVMVFPTSCGRFWDYEDHGMIEAMQEFINNGEIIVAAVDGRDEESWYKPVRDEWIGRRQDDYERCIMHDVIPFLRETYGMDEKYLATGNSFGAFHSANISLKHPEYFDSAICLSGVYAMSREMDGYFDEGIYFNSPSLYMQNLSDSEIINRLRNNYYVISHGRGAWEAWNDQAEALADALWKRDITVWYDPWGEEWPHDWNTWLLQIKKYLTAFREGVMFKDGLLKITGPERRINRL
ncbi:MAG: prolyl oligopeptidase family serine peptidase [Elusimicrobiales bacterium]|nr:prolyl oligopeptidase family serine peptidase [Elusimicrobiales bacterium]